jgi:hypothetical protein
MQPHPANMIGRTAMEVSRILEIYALRWGIEVYFKESKRHLGRLKEQPSSFTSPIASILWLPNVFACWYSPSKQVADFM